MAQKPTPLREQTRSVVRALLARTALELFAAKGYDDTRLEEIAAAAGVSKRTLFNYFRSKEDLALNGLSEQGELIAARLAERPADEDPWMSLRAAFQVLEEIETTAERRLELVTLLFGNESLRAGHAEKQARWQELFAPLIEPRLPGSDHRALQARAIAAAAITCLQAATEEWMRLGGQVDQFDLYDAAVQAIRRPSSPPEEKTT
ncbi:TetR/AcrR family transcriptional regulator [Streptomyces sp. DSM 40750]|uniref:TetR/AcrR family transcriptional regulator n=1 Tax=Streptomyces sp. DSM 40750 TaxID=2801030 RepID=UPI00214B4091|nr:TetR/AcrR family transcriptional regulator [Streptomyces sp. DSM 40750]UUU19258.1 TetR/AcrR family transcriptional regulator [Streptomyces sp. DSM 40750]UUU27398.1 TetR/AcrR family transcriptional regulator [Streptomyces sp. DSM 40750]